MFKSKSLLGILLAVFLVVAQVAAAQAASPGQTVTSTDTPTPTATATSNPCLASSGTSTGGTTSGGTSSTSGGTSSSTMPTNPVAEALCNYFNGPLGLTLSDVQKFAGEGFGYGEIAQACWMAKVLGGDAALCESILMAKQDGSISKLTLPNGVTANNWGQLKKAVFMAFDNQNSNGHSNEGHHSLGDIMGHAGGKGSHGPNNQGGGD